MAAAQDSDRVRDLDAECLLCEPCLSLAPDVAMVLRGGQVYVWAWSSRGVLSRIMAWIRRRAYDTGDYGSRRYFGYRSSAASLW